MNHLTHHEEDKEMIVFFSSFFTLTHDSSNQKAEI